ncbi:MAG: PilN domain-containing protein [Leptolyngbyaceae cyanobacterium]
MYGLDINFLKDREIRPVEQTAAAAGPAAPPGDRRPLFIGLGVAVAALAAVGGYWLLLQQQIRTLEAEERDLDSKIAEIQGQIQEINNIRAQIDLVRAENQAFANVFNQIRPWSAMLQELRQRTPNGIQLGTVRQTGGVTPPDDPEAQPPQAGGIEIVGTACDFDDINDFALVLQRSPLLDSETVLISNSTRQEESQDPEVDGRCPNTPTDAKFYTLVNYTIQANFTDIPASQLLETLDRQGAVGLGTRIRALRDSGVIDTP